MSVRTPLGALLAVVPALLVLAACASGTASSTRYPDSRSVPASKQSHVVVLVMENKEYGEVIGSGEAPYMNSLAKRYALPRNLFASTHPSLPNYLALIGGSTFGVDSDCTSCYVRASNLVDQLEKAHVSWKAYMEEMPRACYTGAEHGRYAKKHNPFLYFDDIRKNSARCSRVVPARTLSSDLSKGRLPKFAWITPDLCNDTHDCSVGTGDEYLSHLVPSLIRALGPHGFVILTYDEGDSDLGCCSGDASGGRIATVIAGPDVRKGATPSAAYDTYSILRTIEDAFGLGHLRHAGHSHTRALDAAFAHPPRGLARR